MQMNAIPQIYWMATLDLLPAGNTRSRGALQREMPGKKNPPVEMRPLFWERRSTMFLYDGLGTGPEAPNDRNCTDVCDVLGRKKDCEDRRKGVGFPSRPLAT